MNIVYIGLSYYPPQIWKTDILKVSNEASKNNTVTLFVKSKSKNFIVEKIGNKTIYLLPSRGENSILDEIIYLLYIPYILKKYHIQADIFHIYNPFFLVFLLQIFIKILYPKSNIIFDIRTGPLKEWFKKILNYILITLGHITASSTIIIHKNLLKNFFYIKKNTVSELALWYEKTEIRSLSSIQENKKFIYIGSIYPRRKIEIFLDSFVQYFREYPDDTITLLWWGDEEYLKNLKKKYTQENIIFLGSVDQDKVQSYLLDSDYGVAYIPMSSYFMDQPPLKTIEYLWAWLPVIGTRTNGNQLFIKNTNGILTGDSMEDFKQWILEFRKKFENYIPSEINKSVEEYEWKNLYSSIEDIYRKNYGWLIQR